MSRSMPRGAAGPALLVAGAGCGSAANGFVEFSSDAPKHDGHDSGCVVRGGLLTFEGPAQVLVDQTDHDVRTVVAAVAGIGSARVEFADGTTAPLGVDSNTLVWTSTGPAARAPVRIRVGALACRVDGRGSEAIAQGFDGSGRLECSGAGPT